MKAKTMPLAALLTAGLMLTLASPPIARADNPWAVVAGKTYGARLNRVAYRVADMLEANLLYSLNRTVPVLATSFVNLDRLESSSTFGRLLGDKVASRFAQHGYKVMELKLRKESVAVQEGNGEVALSRDLDQIITSYEAQAIIVGTYMVSENLAYLTTKLVSTADHSILSSYDFSMRLDRHLAALADNETRPRPPDPPEEAEPQAGPLAGGSTHIDPSTARDAMLIQSRLAELGFYDGEVDGKWGKRSRAALKAFKLQAGLAPVYQWDLDTQKSLFRDSGR